MYGHEMDVALFEEASDVICVDASLHAFCEDRECYIPLLRASSPIM